MFSQLEDGLARRRIKATDVSLLLHGALLAWLLHSPAAIFVAPSSVVYGVPTGSVTQLYWPAHPSNEGEAGAPAVDKSAQAQPSRKQLTWKRENDRASAQAASRENAFQKAGEQQAAAAASNSLNQPSPAGSRYGSLSSGPAWGPEVRPALWASGTDPVITPVDLSGIREGNIVVEITIDQQGNVIDTRVLQSLSPTIDQKVTSALIRWRFRPATRDGIAIASK